MHRSGFPVHLRWLLLMRFPLIEQVGLPVHFERYMPGALHPDGRRYLPQLVFRLANGLLMSVVDRHHYIDGDQAGQEGTARFVYLLSTIALQPPGTQRQGIVAEAQTPGHVSTAPRVYGQIVALPSWELRRDALPYDTLYTELLLDVGAGIVGVRTSLTADNIAEQIGAAELAVGDWLAVSRSRIDILGFTPQVVNPAQG